ncbi:MAG: hypothetical protein KBF75_12635 [Saprospiraceae bacterium]|nr:hypothetical protein [Saprospiraceae bacterium]
MHNLRGQHIINSNCSEDSSSYGKLDTLLYNIAMNGKFEYRYHGKELRDFMTKSDTMCSIKNYAIVLDKILNMGLDLTKPLPSGFGDSRMSLDSTQMRRWREESRAINREVNRIRGLFYLFVEVKDEYEKKFSYIEDSKHLKKEIAALIRYGTWTHPDVVRNAILLKLKHIDADKPNKDYSDSLRKAKKKRQKATDD